MVRAGNIKSRLRDRSFTVFPLFLSRARAFFSFYHSLASSWMRAGRQKNADDESYESSIWRNIVTSRILRELRCARGDIVRVKRHEKSRNGDFGVETCRRKIQNESHERLTSLCDSPRCKKYSRQFWLLFAFLRTRNQIREQTEMTRALKSRIAITKIAQIASRVARLSCAKRDRAGDKEKGEKRKEEKKMDLTRER